MYMFLVHDYSCNDWSLLSALSNSWTLPELHCFCLWSSNLRHSRTPFCLAICIWWCWFLCFIVISSSCLQDSSQIVSTCTIASLTERNFWFLYAFFLLFLPAWVFSFSLSESMLIVVAQERDLFFDKGEKAPLEMKVLVTNLIFQIGSWLTTSFRLTITQGLSEASTQATH